MSGEINTVNYNYVEIFVNSRFQKSISLTVAQGTDKISKGTTLGIVTDTGYAAPYNATHSDGTETAVCIAGTDIDASSTGQNRNVDSWGYTHGCFNLTTLQGLGLDNKAISDMHGRLIPGMNEVDFT